MMYSRCDVLLEKLMDLEVAGKFLYLKVSARQLKEGRIE